MSKTLQEMQIEVAQYWAGVEEMRNCYWFLKRTGSIETEISVEVKKYYARMMRKERGFIWGNSVGDWGIALGPYLKIEDGNPWSSAAILSRCGKEDQSVVKFLGLINQSKHEGDLFNKETYLIWSAMEGELLRSWRAGNLVLYYNIGLQWLHKYAPEVWAKGMEALR